MEEYYFLFVLGILFIFSAAIQDLKRREVANWINFSLICFGLAYRALYSVSIGDYKFFLLGLLGFLVFFLFANVFYYSKTFGGGDAKLLMALGVLLPYNTYYDLFIVCIVFVFILLTVGAIWSLFYSVILVSKNWNKFKKEFGSYTNKFWKLILIVALVLLFPFMLLESFYFAFGVFLLSLVLLWMYIYLKSLDKCMIRTCNPRELTEGDWLEEEVKVNGKWIRKSVHGLSTKDIELLRKYRIKVKIKEGIPFVPAFLITFLLMVFFYSILKLDLNSILQNLFFP